MREIVFDTETTGLDNREDRIIEIGCVELVNRFPTGNTLHLYINPDGRSVHPEALAVHGISDADLVGKPLFSEVADQVIEFFSGAKLIAHNAKFDMGFINAELERVGQLPIEDHHVLDTLVLARRKHPMGPNSLDALCRRYGIDNSRRTLHGALLDAELLAEVYIELIGGKQASFGLEVNAAAKQDEQQGDVEYAPLPERAHALPSRLTDFERLAHQEMVASIGAKALWLNVAGLSDGLETEN